MSNASKTDDSNVVHLSDRALPINTVVRLNSGGPNMLICESDPLLPKCVWVSEAGICRYNYFRTETLTIVAFVLNRE